MLDDQIDLLIKIKTVNDRSRKKNGRAREIIDYPGHISLTYLTIPACVRFQCEEWPRSATTELSWLPTRMCCRSLDIPLC